MTEGVSQSLAGRAAVLHLLPPDRAELTRFENAPETLWDALFSGSYPRIYDRKIAPQTWLRDYVATYVDRDVRQVVNVGDLSTFTTFVRLMAGRTAGELNLSNIGRDVGVSHNNW